MALFRDEPGDISNRERTDFGLGGRGGGTGGGGEGIQSQLNRARHAVSTAASARDRQAAQSQLSALENSMAQNLNQNFDTMGNAINAGNTAQGVVEGVAGAFGPIGSLVKSPLGKVANYATRGLVEGGANRSGGVGSQFGGGNASGSSRVGDMQPTNAFGGQFSGNYGSAPGTQNGVPEPQGGALQPWQQAGTSALQQQQALLGMGGQESQQQAFEAFGNSPGQQFLRDRQQKALMRNSAAMGGLGGGNVRTALQEQAAGNAAQDYSNQFNRLGQLSGQGFQATTAGLDENFRNTLNAQQLSQMAQQKKAGQTEDILNLVGQFEEPLGDMFSNIGDSVSDWIGW